MPTYEYRCEKGHEFEAFQRMSDPPLTACPACGAAAQRRISAGTGLVFKGSGFYITDYKRADEKKAKDRKKAEKAGAAGSSGESGKSDTGKSGAEKSGESKASPSKSGGDGAPRGSRSKSGSGSGSGGSGSGGGD
jgi:putative FmdB family regulatory protein